MKYHPAAKSLVFASLLALAGAFALSSVHAGEIEKKEKKVSKKVLEKYDLNHNGILDPDEEAAWKADRDQAKADRKKKQEDRAAKEAAGPEKPN